MEENRLVWVTPGNGPNFRGILISQAGPDRNRFNILNPKTNVMHTNVHRKNITDAAEVAWPIGTIVASVFGGFYGVVIGHAPDENGVICRSFKGKRDRVCYSYQPGDLVAGLEKFELCEGETYIVRFRGEEVMHTCVAIRDGKDILLVHQNKVIGRFAFGLAGNCVSGSELIYLKEVIRG